MKHAHHENRLDQMTSTRLARLASRPVDTSRLQKHLERVLRGEMIQEPAASPLPSRRWWRPITTAAAAILIAVTIGWLALGGGTSTAMASPTELAQIHFDVANGLSPHLKVSSVVEANRVLADRSSGAVPVPELPGKLLSCCLHQHAGTTLTCALIELDGQLVTVAMADREKLQLPAGRVVTRDGKRYIAHTTNGINMVMANEGNRWLCVMGDASTDTLLGVATKIAQALEDAFRVSIGDHD